MFAILSPWLFLSLGALTFANPTCRCLFGKPCWPSDSTFSELASQLSQPILHPRPPESACYPPSDPSGNCTDVRTNALDGRWRSDQPGAAQLPNYETFIFGNGTISACYLNTTLAYPCTQGSVPDIGVDARTADDVIAAVGFAAKYNLRLVIKNTGYVEQLSLVFFCHYLNLLAMIFLVEARVVVPF